MRAVSAIVAFIALAALARATPDAEGCAAGELEGEPSLLQASVVHPHHNHHHAKLIQGKDPVKGIENVKHFLSDDYANDKDNKLEKFSDTSKYEAVSPAEKKLNRKLENKAEKEGELRSEGDSDESDIQQKDKKKQHKKKRGLIQQDSTMDAKAQAGTKVSASAMNKAAEFMESHLMANLLKAHQASGNDAKSDALLDASVKEHMKKINEIARAKTTTGSAQSVEEAIAAATAMFVSHKAAAGHPRRGVKGIEDVPHYYKDDYANDANDPLDAFSASSKYEAVSPSEKALNEKLEGDALKEQLQKGKVPRDAQGNEANLF